MSDLYFFNNEQTKYVRFSKEAYEHIVSYAQYSCFSREAGGELFSTCIEDGNIYIEIASGPHNKDRRRRASFNQNPKAATDVRHSMFSISMYPVGMWHTHPEKYPTPSSLDRSTVIEYFESLGDAISQYAMVICGNSKYFPTITVEVVQKNNSSNYQWKSFKLDADTKAKEDTHFELTRHR
jgi:proteasome lid subunit RPN8/RPN11